MFGVLDLVSDFFRFFTAVGENLGKECKEGELYLAWFVSEVFGPCLPVSWLHCWSLASGKDHGWEPQQKNTTQEMTTRKQRARGKTPSKVCHSDLLFPMRPLFVPPITSQRCPQLRHRLGIYPMLKLKPFQSQYFLTMRSTSWGLSPQYVDLLEGYFISTL